jgi:putative ABC transport system permease protein
MSGQVRTAPAALSSRIRTWWPAVTGTGAAASAALAILVLVCAFIAVAVPRASLGYRTQVLQPILRAAPATQTAVLGDADLSGLDQAYLSPGQLAFAGSTIAGGLQRAGLPLAPAAAQWDGLTYRTGELSGAPRPAAEHMQPPQLDLLYRSGLASNATLVAGSLPSRAHAYANSANFQVAVTAATAARLGLHVGSQLRSAGQQLVVSGIIRPRGASSSFWTVDPSAAAPRLTYPSRDSPPYLSSAAFVGQAELSIAEDYLSTLPLHAVWSFPLDTGSVNADQAAGLLSVLQRVSYLPVVAAESSRLSSATNATAAIAINLSCGLVTALPAFVAPDSAVQRALSLLFVSLAAIAAVVVLLGARLVTEHRRPEFAMMQARGASLRQVATVAATGGAAVVLPAAFVAVGAAVLATPGPASWLSWWLAALITVTALACPPVLAVWWHRTRRDAGPARLAPAARRRIATARRWVSDGALVCGAVGGLIILRQQGLPPPGSVDLFTSVAPVLVAIPVALCVVRAYPLVLRQLTRLARRRRGVVMVVGLARGSAAARTSLLPAFALILTLTVIAFATMARGAVARADISASWHAAGADAVISAPPTGPGITPAALRQITGVPGTQRTAIVSVTTGTSDQGLPLPVVIVDPQRYAALTGGTPAPRFPAAALAQPGSGIAGSARGVPTLASAEGLATLGQNSGLLIAGRHLQLHLAGDEEDIAGMPAGGQFVILPAWAFGNRVPQPTVIALVGPRLDTAALERVVRRTVPGAQITLRSRLLAAISGAPLPHGGFVTFAQGAAAAGAFGLLILLLMLVLSARSREMTLARLITMGLGPAQSRRITAVETLPAILAAAVGGTACALVLVPLVGPAVNLAAFAGMPVSVPLHADPVAIAVAVGGLAVLAVLTLSIQDILARRLGAGQALRVGE